MQMEVGRTVQVEHGGAACTRTVVDKTRPVHLTVGERDAARAGRRDAVAVAVQGGVTLEQSTLRSGKHRVVENGSKLAVVVPSPVQTGVIASHRQAVNLHRSSMEFHGRLAGAFRFDVSGGDVNSAAGAARHGVAVVDFERRESGVVVNEMDAFKSEINRIHGQDALAC